MDISKYHIPQLISPNWGPWYERIQSTAHIINIWDAIRGDVITTIPTTTRENIMGPKEFPRSRSHSGHHHECYLATV